MLYFYISIEEFSHHFFKKQATEVIRKVLITHWYTESKSYVWAMIPTLIIYLTGGMYSNDILAFFTVYYKEKYFRFN